MEHIDQEGHQLQKKGQTISTMSSASPLFTGTLGTCSEGVYREKMDVLDKKNCRMMQMNTWTPQERKTDLKSRHNDLGLYTWTLQVDWLEDMQTR